MKSSLSTNCTPNQSNEIARPVDLSEVHCFVCTGIEERKTQFAAAERMKSALRNGLQPPVLKTQVLVGRDN